MCILFTAPFFNNQQWISSRDHWRSHRMRICGWFDVISYSSLWTDWMVISWFKLATGFDQGFLLAASITEVMDHHRHYLLCTCHVAVMACIDESLIGFSKPRAVDFYVKPFYGKVWSDIHRELHSWVWGQKEGTAKWTIFKRRLVQQLLQTNWLHWRTIPRYNNFQWPHKLENGKLTWEWTWEWLLKRCKVCRRLSYGIMSFEFLLD